MVCGKAAGCASPRGPLWVGCRGSNPPTPCGSTAPASPLRARLLLLAAAALALLPVAEAEETIGGQGSVWWEWYPNSSSCESREDGVDSDWTHDLACLKVNTLKPDDPLRVRAGDEAGYVKLTCDDPHSTTNRIAVDDNVIIAYYLNTSGGCDGLPYESHMLVHNASNCSSAFGGVMYAECSRCHWLFKGASSPPYFLQAVGVFVFLTLCIIFNLMFQHKIDHCSKVLPPKILPCCFPVKSNEQLLLDTEEAPPDGQSAGSDDQATLYASYNDRPGSPGGASISTTQPGYEVGDAQIYPNCIVRIRPRCAAGGSSLASPDSRNNSTSLHPVHHPEEGGSPMGRRGLSRGLSARSITSGSPELRPQGNPLHLPQLGMPPHAQPVGTPEHSPRGGGVPIGGTSSDVSPEHLAESVCILGKSSSSLAAAAPPPPPPPHGGGGGEGSPLAGTPSSSSASPRAVSRPTRYFDSSRGSATTEAGAGAGGSPSAITGYPPVSLPMRRASSYRFDPAAAARRGRRGHASGVSGGGGGDTQHHIPIRAVGGAYSPVNAAQQQHGGGGGGGGGVSDPSATAVEGVSGFPAMFTDGGAGLAGSAAAAAAAQRAPHKGGGGGGAGRGALPPPPLPPSTPVEQEEHPEFALSVSAAPVFLPSGGGSGGGGGGGGGNPQSTPSTPLEDMERLRERRRVAHSNTARAAFANTVTLPRGSSFGMDDEGEEEEEVLPRTPVKTLSYYSRKGRRGVAGWERGSGAAHPSPSHSATTVTTRGLSAISTPVTHYSEHETSKQALIDVQELAVISAPVAATCDICGFDMGFPHSCVEYKALVLSGAFGLHARCLSVDRTGGNRALVCFTSPGKVRPSTTTNPQLCDKICTEVGFHMGEDGCVDIEGDVRCWLSLPDVRKASSLGHYVRVVARPWKHCPEHYWKHWYKDFELCVGEVDSICTSPSGEPLLRVGFLGGALLTMPLSAFCESSETEHSGECLMVPQTVERRIMMAVFVASTPPLLAAKAIYLVSLFVMSIVAVFESGHSGRASHHSHWEAYEEVYFKLFNSGYPTLIADCTTVSSYFLLNFHPSPTGFVRGVGIPSTIVLVVTLGVSLPGILTHALPMLFYYGWIWAPVLFLLYQLFKVVVKLRPAPPDMAEGDAYSIRAIWYHHRGYVVKASAYYFLFRFTAELLGVLFLQTSYNYGVLAYDGNRYFKTISLEYQQRDVLCILEHGAQLASLVM